MGPRLFQGNLGWWIIIPFGQIWSVDFWSNFSYHGKSIARTKQKSITTRFCILNSNGNDPFSISPKKPFVKFTWAVLSSLLVVFVESTHTSSPPLMGIVSYPGTSILFDSANSSCWIGVVPERCFKWVWNNQSKWVEIQKYGKTPQIIHFNRVFPL